MKKLALFILSFSLSFTSIAQTTHWHMPPNYGMFPVRTRFEDIYFTNYKTGLAVSIDGELFKTSDAAISWYNKQAATQNGSYRSIEFLDDGQFGIIGGFGDTGHVYRTVDSGETWGDISNNITDTAIHGGKQICGLAHWGDNFYGIGWYGSRSARFYKSLDKGLTWQTFTIDTSLATGLVDITFLSADTGFATGGKSLHAGNHESVVIKTTDGGQTWTKVFSDTSIGGRIWKIQFINRQLAVGSIEPVSLNFPDTVAIIKSLDGGDHWQIMGVGRRSSTQWGTQGVGFIDPLNGWVGGYYNGLFETKDGGVSWDTLNFGANFNRFFVLDQHHMYAGGAMIYRYGDSANFTTSIKEQLIKPINTLYPISPNPAKGKVIIEFDLGRSSNVVLNVVNLDTRVSSPIINRWHQSGHHRYEWDASVYPDGFYIVILDNDDIPITQKFVLTH